MNEKLKNVFEPSEKVQKMYDLLDLKILLYYNMRLRNGCNCASVS